MTDSIILYDAGGSPCGRRVRMCLLEKGIPFEIHWLNLALMDQKAPWYLEMNPNGLVPTLKHGDKVIYESNVINQYLDEVFPQNRLMPEDAFDRAQVQMWMAFELDWAKAFRDAVYETFAKDRLKSNVDDVAKLKDEITKRTKNPYYLKFATKVLTTERDEELLNDRLQVLFEKMDWMEEKLADGREWLVGNTFSLADIALGPRTDMFDKIGVQDFYDRYPRIRAFMERLKARPSWDKSMIMPEPGETSKQVAA